MRTPAEEGIPVAIEEEEAVSARANATGPEGILGARGQRAGEDRYRASFDQAAVGILHTSLQGRILKCNQSFAGIVGYTPEELVGSNFQEITPPEDRNSGQSAAVHLLSGEQSSVSFEKRYLRKDGSLTWVMLTISIQHDDKGQPVFFLTLVQDINARKQAEALLAEAQEALRLSEERYRTAFQMSLDAINLSRLSDGTYVDCNKAFLDTTGYAREEVIGHSSLELNIWENLADRDTLVEMLHQQGVCRNFEARFRKKNGEKLWGLMSASVIELEGAPCILSIARDISEVKTAQDEIRHLAFYDPLTELPNRRLLLERLRQTVTASKRSGRQRALLFIDLDNFKNLNDTLGHAVGDLLLKEVGERLTGCIRAVDTAARVGGDEFVVILEDLGKTSEEAAARAGSVAEKILSSITQPYVLAGHECRSTASMGITVFGDRNESSSAILQQADIAMYQAKAAGREAIRFFAPELQSAVNARAALEGELRQGIRNREFALWYQPQVDRGRVVGAEALLRWNHPRRGILCPAEFIALAEETGLIVPLGNQVLEDACRQLARWAQRPEMAALSVAVNVSPRQFRQADFAERVLAVLEITGANPKSLELEITESLLVEDLEETIAIMNALRARGLRFSLDDFGTGYSSLAYLKRLPLDQLKIDGSFVRDMLGDATSRAIAHAIIWLSREMNLPLLAEGVETEEQRAWLADLGCHTYQGYLFSRPVPVRQFELLLEEARKDPGSSAEAAPWIGRTDQPLAHDVLEERRLQEAGKLVVGSDELHAEHSGIRVDGGAVDGLLLDGVATDFFVHGGGVQQRRHSCSSKGVRSSHIQVEFDAVGEVHGVAGIEEPLLHLLVVGQLRRLTEERMHHVLGALLVENAPDGLGIHLTHGGEHVLVGEEAGSKAVAAIESRLDGVARAEQHGGGIEERDQHAVGAHGIEAIVADRHGLDLLLL